MSDSNEDPRRAGRLRRMRRMMATMSPRQRRQFAARITAMRAAWIRQYAIYVTRSAGCVREVEK